MNGLIDIASVRVPRVCALEAHAHLCKVGKQGLEGFALWAGQRDGSTFNVQQTIIPHQIGLRFSQGVCVTVGAEELHRINVWLYQHNMTLVAQLHSHPTEAYHSDTDDAFPIATTVGSLSLVVPYFAQDPFSIAQCAVYQLQPGAGWVELLQDDVRRLIRIEA